MSTLPDSALVVNHLDKVGQGHFILVIFGENTLQRVRTCAALAYNRPSAGLAQPSGAHLPLVSCQNEKAL